MTPSKSSTADTAMDETRRDEAETWQQADYTLDFGIRLVDPERALIGSKCNNSAMGVARDAKGQALREDTAETGRLGREILRRVSQVPPEVTKRSRMRFTSWKSWRGKGSSIGLDLRRLMRKEGSREWSVASQDPKSRQPSYWSPRPEH